MPMGNLSLQKETQAHFREIERLRSSLLDSFIALGFPLHRARGFLFLPGRRGSNDISSGQNRYQSFGEDFVSTYDQALKNLARSAPKYWGKLKSPRQLAIKQAYEETAQSIKDAFDRIDVQTLNEMSLYLDPINLDSPNLLCSEQEAHEHIATGLNANQRIQESICCIVALNSGLAHDSLNSFVSTRGISRSASLYSDLEMAALEGLQKAAGKFILSRGFKFSTVAKSWLRPAIDKAFTKSHSVRMSAGERSIRASVHAAIDHLKSNREEITPARVAEISGEKIKKVHELLENNFMMTSIDSAIDGQNGEGGARTIADIIADDNSPDPSANMDADILAEATTKFLENLSPTERAVLCYFYGYNGDSNPSFIKEDIENIFSVSRERVRQITNMGYRSVIEPRNVSLLICEES